jgi:hypothetical protein
MLVEKIVFKRVADHITSSNNVTLLENLGRFEVVKSILVK